MFRTLAIKQRLFLSGILSFVAIVTVGGIALFSLWKGSNDLDRQITATDSIRFQMLADTIHDGLVVQVTLAVAAGPYSSLDAKEAMRTEFAADAEELRANVNGLLGLDLADDVRAQVQRTIPFVDEFLASAEQTIEIAFTADSAGRAVIPSIMATFEVLEVELGAMGDLIQQSSYATAAQAQELMTTLIYVLLATTGIAGLGVGYSARKMSLSIYKPLERLEDALLEIAKGDFGIHIADRMRDDDIGMIARNVDKISERVVAALQEQEDAREESEMVISALGTGLKNISEGRLSEHITKKFADEYEPLRQSYNTTIDQLNTLMSQVVKVSKSIQSRTSQISRLQVICPKERRPSRQH